MDFTGSIQAVPGNEASGSGAHLQRVMVKLHELAFLVPHHVYDGKMVTKGIQLHQTMGNGRLGRW